MKGKMELAVKTLAFDRLSIFHPYNLIKQGKENDSYFKKALNNIIAFFAKIMPAKQKAIQVEDVATAMKLEFELRLTAKVEKIAYYDSDLMRKLMKNDTK